MSTLRKKGESWEVDFYVCGERFRKSFGKKERALKFKSDFDHFYSIKPLTLDKATAKYLKVETDMRKTSGNAVTERKFFWELKKFLGSKGQKGFSNVIEIEPYHLQAFQLWLKSQKHNGKLLENATVNRRFHTIKHFFMKLVEWGYLNESPARFIKPLPENRRPKKLWSMEEVLKVSGALSSEDKALFVFLYFTGARLSTALRLTWFDVDMKSEVITFTTKKGKISVTREYKVPMPKPVKILLSDIPKTGGEVFEIKAGLFAKRISRTLKKVGIEGLTLHGLRHTFASRIHEKGASTETIRLLLGHSNTKTTEGYLSTDLDHLRKFVA